MANIGQINKKLFGLTTQIKNLLALKQYGGTPYELGFNIEKIKLEMEQLTTQIEMVNDEDLYGSPFDNLEDPDLYDSPFDFGIQSPNIFDSFTILSSNVNNKSEINPLMHQIEMSDNDIYANSLNFV